MLRLRESASRSVCRENSNRPPSIAVHGFSERYTHTGTRKINNLQTLQLKNGASLTDIVKIS